MLFILQGGRLSYPLFDMAVDERTEECRTVWASWQDHMASCWEADAADRPSFQVLRQHIMNLQALQVCGLIVRFQRANDMHPFRLAICRSSATSAPSRSRPSTQQPAAPSARPSLNIERGGMHDHGVNWNLLMLQQFTFLATWSAKRLVPVAAALASLRAGCYHSVARAS